ncbi:Uncharacterized protein TCM_037138 [Theobroma cacao]|uniref:Uncharacterized protein n=1 Tax=Theobroma cacao TaxID=3641 RepID=A0A061GJW0_THECC|nr:Uncharacterized protein TCM_037138 [Theobroma cacao]
MGLGPNPQQCVIIFSVVVFFFLLLLLLFSMTLIPPLAFFLKLIFGRKIICERGEYYSLTLRSMNREIA